MKLKTIKYENLKGRSEEIAFGDATLIYGPNFAGKTTIIDAIKLLLLGYHPSLDKTARGIFELSSGVELTVGGVLAGTKPPERSEFPIARKWSSVNGKINRKDFLPVDWPDVPAVLLDANEYFGASDRGKTELLFAAAPIKCKVTAPQLNKALLEYGLMVENTPGETTQAFVELAMMAAELQRSDAAASKRRMQGTLQGLSQIRLRDDTRSLIDDVPGKLKAKRSELETESRHLERAKYDQPDATKERAAEREAVDEVAATARRLAEALDRRETTEKRWSKLLTGKVGSLFCKKCKANAEKLSNSDLSELDKEITGLKRENKAARDELATAKEKAEQKERRARKASQKDIDAIEEKIAGLRQEVAALEKEERLQLSEANDKKRLADARDELERSEQLEKKMGEAKAFLLETKAAMTTELFAPILKVAGQFTKFIFDSSITFRNGEFGRWGKLAEFPPWIPHRVFSGTEQAIAFAALQAALGASAPIKLVVMDELGRIDRKNKMQLLENIADALEAGIIEQFIGIDTERPEIEPKGGRFTLIERGA